MRLGAALVVLMTLLSTLPVDAAPRRRAVGAPPSNALPPPPPAILGSLQFTADTAKTVTIHARPELQTTGTVRTPDGRTWTLVVPAWSLAFATDITLTPMSAVHATTTPVSPRSGVVLGPQGLSFSGPVTLTVTASDAAREQIFMADDDGSGVDWTEPSAAAAGSVAAVVPHFSVDVIGEDPKTFHQAVVDAAEAAQREFHFGMPPVPAFHPDCSNQGTPSAAKQAQVSRFLEQFLQPQEREIREILVSRLPNSVPSAQEIAVLNSLGQSLSGAYVNMALNVDVDHLLSIVALRRRVLEAVKQTSSLRAAAGADSALQARIYDIASKGVARIRNAHDFSQFDLVLFAMHEMADADQSGTGILPLLQQAFRFRLTLDRSATGMTGGQSLELVQNGEYELTMDDHLNIAGESSMSVRGHGSSPDMSTADLASTIYPATATLANFDACGAATLTFSQMQPLPENWSICAEMKCTVFDLTGSDPTAQLYAPERTGTGYAFSALPFTNGSSTPIDYVLTPARHAPARGVDVSERIHFLLVHQPQ